MQRRYQEYLKATPIERLSMDFAEEELETSKDYEKVRSIITEMLFQAVPKSLAAEAITKRLDTTLKSLLRVVINYKT